MSNTFKASSRRAAGTLRALRHPRTLGILFYHPSCCHYYCHCFEALGAGKFAPLLDRLLHMGPAQETLFYPSPSPAESSWEVSYKLNPVFPLQSMASTL